MNVRAHLVSALPPVQIMLMVIAVNAYLVIRVRSAKLILMNVLLIRVFTDNVSMKSTDIRATVLSDLRASIVKRKFYRARPYHVKMTEFV